MPHDDCGRIPFWEWLSASLIPVQSTIRGVFSWMLRPGAWAATGVGAMYGLLQLAKSQDWPNAADWRNGTDWHEALTGFGIAGVTAYFLVTVGYSLALRRSDQDKNLVGACREIARVVCTRTGIPYDNIGAHVWTVTGLPGLRYLRRRAKFVPFNRRTTPITWRKGKGVLGVCWMDKRSFVADLDALRRVSEPEASEAFRSLSREDRFRLSWKEFVTPSSTQPCSWYRSARSFSGGTASVGSSRSIYSTFPTGLPI
jgi:hypothetical protein